MSSAPAGGETATAALRSIKRGGREPAPRLSTTTRRSLKRTWRRRSGSERAPLSPRPLRPGALIERASAIPRGEREAWSVLASGRTCTGKDEEGRRPAWGEAEPDLPRGALGPWPRASALVAAVRRRPPTPEVRSHGPGV